jgi:hypothetical protein
VWSCSCGHEWNTFDTGGVCHGLPPSVDFNPVPQVRRLVPAFGLVYEMTCLYWHSTGKAALALNPRPAFSFTSAANSVPLPEPKPRAMREHFVMPSIRSREVACAEWPNIRRFEHFL